MSILYGLYSPDEGEIEIGSAVVRIDSPSKAIEQGIGMVHQHFMLVPVMTVAENIVLGAGAPRRAARRGRGDREVRELSERYGFAVDPDAVIEDVTVGTQQRVEILKTLYRGARILVLDEPTAVLTAQEASELFEVLRALKADGVAIVFITHKLGEVLEIADRVTVLRRGRKIDTVPAEGATEQSLARLMVGRDVLLQVDKLEASRASPSRGGGPARARRPRAREAVRGVSMEVRARGRGSRGRGRQRPAGAGGGHRRPQGARSRPDRRGRRGRHRTWRSRHLRRRSGPHRRGPPAARAGTRFHAGREPGAA